MHHSVIHTCSQGKIEKKSTPTIPSLYKPQETDKQPYQLSHAFFWHRALRPHRLFRKHWLRQLDSKQSTRDSSLRWSWHFSLRSRSSFFSTSVRWQGGCQVWLAAQVLKGAKFHLETNKQQDRCSGNRRKPKVPGGGPPNEATVDSVYFLNKSHSRRYFKYLVECQEKAFELLFCSSVLFRF